MEALGLGMVGGGTFFAAEDTESTEGTGGLQQKARTERRGALVRASLSLLAWL